MKTTSYDLDESQAEESASAQIEHDQAALSDTLFCLAQQMTALGLTGVNEFIKKQCIANQVDYPPQQVIGLPAAC